MSPVDNVTWCVNKTFLVFLCQSYCTHYMGYFSIKTVFISSVRGILFPKPIHKCRKYPCIFWLNSSSFTLLAKSPFCIHKFVFGTNYFYAMDSLFFCLQYRQTVDTIRRFNEKEPMQKRTNRVQFVTNKRHFSIILAYSSLLTKFFALQFVDSAKY